MTHCRKCGSELAFRSTPTGKFDSGNGLPTQHEYLVCPSWSKRLFGDNGHDWWHRGVNPIKPPPGYLPDPFKLENAPSPR